MGMQCRDCLRLWLLVAFRDVGGMSIRYDICESHMPCGKDGANGACACAVGARAGPRPAPTATRACSHPLLSSSASSLVSSACIAFLRAKLCRFIDAKTVLEKLHCITCVVVYIYTQYQYAVGRRDYQHHHRKPRHSQAEGTPCNRGRIRQTLLHVCPLQPSDSTARNLGSQPS